MTYKILRDYHTEGYKLEDGDYETVDAAVKDALKTTYTAGFLIVQVVDWKAQEI